LGNEKNEIAHPKTILEPRTAWRVPSYFQHFDKLLTSEPSKRGGSICLQDSVDLLPDVSHITLGVVGLLCRYPLKQAQDEQTRSPNFKHHVNYITTSSGTQFHSFSRANAVWMSIKAIRERRAPISHAKHPQNASFVLEDLWGELQKSGTRSLGRKECGSSPHPTIVGCV